MCASPCSFFFFNDTATTEIYTLSLHDALPIFLPPIDPHARRIFRLRTRRGDGARSPRAEGPSGTHSRAPQGCKHRSEEHTSELQSLAYLVCRLLLEKKKNTSRHARQHSVTIRS